MDAPFHFQHSCSNPWKRHLPSINVLLDIGAARAQMHFVPNQWFFITKHMFFVRFIDVGIGVEIDVSGPTVHI